MKRWMVSWMVLLSTAACGENPPLVCFVDKMENLGKNPVYVLGKEGKLHPVPDGQVRERFWGRGWPRRLEFWGNRQGRPAPGKERDFMRAKGAQVALDTAWLDAYVEVPRGGRPDPRPEPIEVGSVNVKGLEIRMNGSSVDRQSLEEATRGMSQEQKAYMEGQAEKEAAQAKFQAEAARRQILPDANQIDREVNEAIRRFDARLGKASGLMQTSPGSRRVCLVREAGMVNLEVINGDISMETYLKLMKTEKDMVRDKRKMEKFLRFE